MSRRRLRAVSESLAGDPERDRLGPGAADPFGGPVLGKAIAAPPSPSGIGPVGDHLHSRRGAGGAQLGHRALSTWYMHWPWGGRPTNLHPRPLRRTSRWGWASPQSESCASPAGADIAVPARLSPFKYSDAFLAVLDSEGDQAVALSSSRSYRGMRLSRCPPSLLLTRSQLRLRLAERRARARVPASLHSLSLPPSLRPLSQAQALSLSRPLRVSLASQGCFLKVP